MKKNIKISVVLFLALACSFLSSAQINRTLETKVVDLLAQLPTADLEHADRLMQEAVDLGEEGILEFTSRLIPAGQGNDVQVRYFVHSLATYAGRGETVPANNTVEGALQKAIDDSKDSEVKTFLMERLAFCGTESSVEFLSAFLEEEDYYKTALAVLGSIGTESAGRMILNRTMDADQHRQWAFAQALGDMRYAPANDSLVKLSESTNWTTVRYALRSMSEIADPASYKPIVKTAKLVKYLPDEKQAVLSLINFGNRSLETGNRELAEKVGEQLLKNCKDEKQLHFRTAGLYMFSEAGSKDLNELLLEELENDDLAYRGAVLELADEQVIDQYLADWVGAYQSSPSSTRTQLAHYLGKRNDQQVFSQVLVPAINSKDEDLRVAGIKAMAYQDPIKSVEALTTKLERQNTDRELFAIEETYLRVLDQEGAGQLSGSLGAVSDDGKMVLVKVLGARAVTGAYQEVKALVPSGNEKLDMAAYEAMANIGGSEEIVDMLQLLDQVEGEKNIQALQGSLVQVMDGMESKPEQQVMDAYKGASNAENYIPLLVALENETALLELQRVLNEGTQEQKLVATQTLGSWRNNEAIPVLFEMASAEGTEESLRARSFELYLRQVVGSSHPDDQKLLLIRKIYPFHKNKAEKTGVIRAAGTVKTFLSLVFVSEFLEDPETLRVASNTAIRIALPTPISEGLSGDVVRDIVSRSIDNLSGQDAQYLKIDVKEFLDNMPSEKGFLPIFNGKDLSGWKGLVEDPIKRGKMSAAQLEKKQEAADKQMHQEWVVKDGRLTFVGEGFKNICTVKEYGDFEMIVDWRIGEGGDSGVYLRGTPQVQIWDTALTEVGAQVGSGGLYNNEQNPSTPEVVADNPVNDWNTFRIIMEGDKVTVYLNGILVVDQVTMENYWDRNQGIFPTGSIELQAHGENVAFRDIYVRELQGSGVELSEEEVAEGFVPLFNGINLDNWIGNKKDYFAEGGELVVQPAQGNHGNLYTEEEYDDFVLRFEFQLTEGANNGLGFHAPLEGDIAYVGKESQILDNTAEVYAELEEYQYHGSIYGIIAAERGHLKPLGEWNSEEIQVNGNKVKITLNGQVILEGDIDEASKNGTLDGKEHPGIQRKRGYIAFLGHGSELRFRNVRIKELNK